jgi:hypothetical protein
MLYVCVASARRTLGERLEVTCELTMVTAKGMRRTGRREGESLGQKDDGATPEMSLLSESWAYVSGDVFHRHGFCLTQRGTYVIMVHESEEQCPDMKVT